MASVYQSGLQLIWSIFRASGCFSFLSGYKWLVFPLAFAAFS